MPISNQQLPDKLHETAARAHRASRHSWVAMTFLIIVPVLALLIPSVKQILRQHAVLVFYLSIIVGAYGVWHLTAWRLYGTPVSNFKKSAKNLAALEKLIATHRPYGIYLRDFRSEGRLPAPTIIDHGAVTVPTYSDNVERTLVNQVSRYLPFFALMNTDDIDDGPIARRIYCDNEAWFDTFVAYAENAALFIINVDSLQPGVIQELEWVFQLNRKGRVVLVAPAPIIRWVRSRYPKMDGQYWIVPRSERSVDYDAPTVKAPESLLRFVRSLE